MDVILFNEQIGLEKAKQYQRGEMTSSLEKNELDKINVRVSGNIRGYRVVNDGFIITDEAVYVTLQEMDTYHKNEICMDERFSGDIHSVVGCDRMFETLSYLVDKKELRGSLYLKYLEAAL